MRYILELGNRVIRTWWFWAFVLLVIPNCALNSQGTGCPLDDLQCICNDNPNDPKCQPPDCDENIPGDCKPLCPDESNPACIDPPPVCPDVNNPACPPVVLFDPGPLPNSDAIMCEFPVPVDPLKSDCASAAEAADPANVWLNQAATALATGKHSAIALDWSTDATTACLGLPRKITFLDGVYPDGSTLCLNCDTQIMGTMGNPPVYASTDKACITKCQDYINMGNGYKPANIPQYCADNAHTAPNFDKKICYKGACSPGGTPIVFDDPRKHPEKLMWTDELGTVDNGGLDYNTLVRNAPTSVPADFDAGAASVQIVKGGDGWIEFEVAGNGGHMIGVRNSCDNAVNCQDMDPGRDDFTNALQLHEDGNVYVQEGVPFTFTPALGAPYAAGEFFRVKWVDNRDGTATVSYARHLAACVDGTPCADGEFYTSAYKPSFPLRVDASLRTQNATLSHVTIVYLQQ